MLEARKVQNQRFALDCARSTDVSQEELRDFEGSREAQVHSNAEMSSKQIRQYCKLDRKSSELLKKAMNSLGFSARAYDRILKVARTIADLEKVEDIGANHIAEAIQYRSLDRENWAG